MFIYKLKTNIVCKQKPETINKFLKFLNPMFSSLTSLFSMFLFSKSTKTENEDKNPFHNTSKVSSIHDLSKCQKFFLSQKCKEKLFTNNTFSFSCTKKTKKNELSPGFLKMIKYLQRNGINQNLIFRDEGDKKIYNELARYIHEDKEIDYSMYSILDLASSLKAYLRIYLNGFFNKDLFTKVFASIKKAKGKACSQFVTVDINSKHYDSKYINLLSKYIIFSLTDLERQSLFELQHLINLIDGNKNNNKMSYTSVVNILSLNMLPEEIFQDLYIIPDVVFYFQEFFKMDMENLQELIHLFE